MRNLLAALVLVMLVPTSASADAYRVSYNPYGNIDWPTILYCQSQHHDHVSSAGRVMRYDLAGYDAVTFMTYSGLYRPSTPIEWAALGSPAIDPGQPVGWVESRRWPPEDHGAPLLEDLSNIRLYIPGAEEVGLLPDGHNSYHIHSAFLTTYIEGQGSDACGVQGNPVAQNNSGLAGDQIYSSNQEMIDLIRFHGGHATLNHAINLTALPDGL